MTYIEQEVNLQKLKRQGTSNDQINLKHRKWIHCIKFAATVKLHSHKIAGLTTQVYIK